MKNKILIFFTILIGLTPLADAADITVRVWNDLDGNLLFDENPNIVGLSGIQVLLSPGNDAPALNGAFVQGEIGTSDGMGEIHFTGLSNGFYRLDLSPQTLTLFSPTFTTLNVQITNDTLVSEQALDFPYRHCGGCFAPTNCEKTQDNLGFYDGQAGPGLLCDHVQYFEIATCCATEFSPVVPVLQPGVTNITAQWSTGDTNLSTMLPDGTHYLILIDHDTGCVSSNPVVASSDGSPFAVNVVQDPPITCSSNGSIRVCLDRALAYEPLYFSAIALSTGEPVTFTTNAYNQSFRCSLDASGFRPANPPTILTSGPAHPVYKFGAFPPGSYEMATVIDGFPCPLTFEFEIAPETPATNVNIATPIQDAGCFNDGRIQLDLSAWAPVAYDASFVVFLIDDAGETSEVHQVFHSFANNGNAAIIRGLSAGDYIVYISFGDTCLRANPVTIAPSCADVTVRIWLDLNVNGEFDENPSTVGFSGTDQRVYLFPEGDTGTPVRGQSKTLDGNSQAVFTGLANGVYRIELDRQILDGARITDPNPIVFELQNGKVISREDGVFDVPFIPCGGCLEESICEEIQDTPTYDGQIGSAFLCDIVSVLAVSTCCGTSTSEVRPILNLSVTNYSVQWSTGDTNLITSLPDGQHHVIIIDHDTGCVSSNNVEISSSLLSTLLRAQVDMVTPAGCSTNGRIRICPNFRFPLSQEGIFMFSLDNTNDVPFFIDDAFNAFDCQFGFRSSSTSPGIPTARTSGPPPLNFILGGLAPGSYMLALKADGFACTLDVPIEVTNDFAPFYRESHTLDPQGDFQSYTVAQTCDPPQAPGWMGLSTTPSTNDLQVLTLNPQPNSSTEPRSTTLAYGNTTYTFVQPGSRPMRLEFIPTGGPSFLPNLEFRIFAERGRAFRIETAEDIAGTWQPLDYRVIVGVEEQDFTRYAPDAPNQFYRLVWE